MYLFSRAKDLGVLIVRGVVLTVGNSNAARGCQLSVSTFKIYTEF